MILLFFNQKGSLNFFKSFFSSNNFKIFLILVFLLFLAQILVSHSLRLKNGYPVIFLAATTTFISTWWQSRRQFFINYLFTALPLLSILLIKYLADSVPLAANDFTIYMLFCLAVSNLLFICHYFCLTIFKTTNNAFLLKPLTLLLCFFSLTIWSYYFISGSFFNNEALLALLQTNASEAKEYLQDGLGIFFLLSLLAIIGIYLKIINRTLPLPSVFTAQRTYPVLIAVFLVLNCLCIYKTANNFFTNIFLQARHNLSLYEDFNHKKAARQKLLANSAVISTKQQGLFILVIGESQNKAHMSAYQYSRPTTPWLTSMQATENFFLFQNAYASHSHTVPALTYALTAKNQYNDLSLQNAASLLEVAEAAGYHTAWLSNQVKYGAWDTPITVIATQAKTQRWLNTNIGETSATNNYDLSLVDALKALPQHNKMLVVLHLMGNHGSYHQRYPQDFAVFNNSAAKRIDEYDNSILFNDYVMQNIYQLTNTLPNFQGLMYFSDHADDVDAGLAHDSSKFTFNMVRIPMYMYFSPAYAAANPDKISALSQNTNSYFTNDMIFDTALGIMNIHSPYNNVANDLSSHSYHHNKNDLKTLYGKKLLSEDIE